MARSCLCLKSSKRTKEVWRPMVLYANTDAGPRWSTCTKSSGTLVLMELSANCIVSWVVTTEPMVTLSMYLDVLFWLRMLTSGEIRAGSSGTARSSSLLSRHYPRLVRISSGLSSRLLGLLVSRVDQLTIIHNNIIYIYIYILIHYTLYIIHILIQYCFWFYYDLISFSIINYFL